MKRTLDEPFATFESFPEDLVAEPARRGGVCSHIARSNLLKIQTAKIIWLFR